MRILWLSQTPAVAKEILNDPTPGCGWISSLQTKIQNDPHVDLGVCFFHEDFKFKTSTDQATFYAIPFAIRSKVSKIYYRLTNAMHDCNEQGLKAVVNDFKPDVIHLFGTESGMGDVLNFSNVPVIIHLQGLINPYDYSWYPKGVSPKQVLMNSPLKAILFKTGYFFQQKFFAKRGLREKSIIKKGRFFFGRTHWDKNYVRLYNKDFEYIQCEEMMRPSFYGHTWTHKPSSKLRFITTINPYLFKGIEIIWDTADILSENGEFEFEWNIAGITKDHDLVKLFKRLRPHKKMNININFLGALDETELCQQLLRSDIYIHPSHMDNSPNSVCEAMILGMPIIAGNVGGVSSIISQHVTGTLYNSHDPYELAGRIMEFFDNPRHFLECGQRARLRAIERHDPSKIVDTVLASYDYVFESNRRDLTSNCMNENIRK